MREFLDRIEWTNKMRKLSISESTYPGNLGMVEMMRFYKIADNAQVDKMDEYLNNGKYRSAWSLLQKVTGTKLKGIRTNKKTEKRVIRQKIL